MKKVLIVMGSIFLVLIVLAVSFFVNAAFKGIALDKEAKAFVDTAVPAIVAAWDERELLKRASPELKKNIAGIDILEQFAIFRSLGKMEEYEGSQGESKAFYNLGRGTTISAEYVAKAQFEVAPAEITIKLIKHGESWQIDSFHVDSPPKSSPAP